MDHWKVRVFSLSASYDLGIFHAASKEEAIKQARERISFKFPDMRGWFYSAWRVGALE